MPIAPANRPSALRISTSDPTEGEHPRERRRHRRVSVPPMYTSLVVRVLEQRQAPVEGSVLNISESGMAAELDTLIVPGSVVTVEFCVSGLGRARMEQWPTFISTAEVVRNAGVEDFPAGPYQTAFRFAHMPTIAQAQIARFVASHAESPS